MSFLHGDDVLNGIKRGAEKFGSASAMKAVKKMAKRLNNYVTDSQEPYGLGMGGGDTEQMSQKTTFVPAKENVKIGIPAAQARQKNKLDFLKRELPLSQDAAERAAIEYEIKAIEAELATMPSGDPDARQDKDSTIGNAGGAGGGSGASAGGGAGAGAGAAGGQGASGTGHGGAVDSSSLGYQSAQKSTTAVRGYDDEEWKRIMKNGGMKSKCPACGHESPDEWNGKCSNCLMPNAEDVGKKMGRSVDNLKNSPETTDGAANIVKGSGPIKSIESTPDNDNLVGYVENAKRTAAEMWGDALDGAKEEMIQELFSGARESSEALRSWSHASWGMLPARVQSAISARWSKARVNATEAETGSSSETKDDVVIAHESLRSNAGHLGPDAWTAASLEERARWLELAHQDVNQAPRAWQDLSADLHVALQDVHDKPATANLDPKATDAEIKNGAGDSLKGGPCSCGHPGSRHFDTGHGEACHDCSCNVYDETIRCRECGQKERAGLAVGGLCEECQNSKENATGKPGKKKFLFKDVQGEEEEVEAASLDQAWALLADIFGEPADVLKKIGVKFVRENADSEGDLSEIARHAEGIEHEVTELKEEGLENGNKWSGKKCPLCAGPVSEHPAGPYGGSPFCKACGEVLDPQDLKNEVRGDFANCAGNCGCKPADHIPDAAGAFKCPCDCAECATAKKSHAKQNDSVDSLEMKSSGVGRGNFKYGSKNK